jgi:hypothetical protein
MRRMGPQMLIRLPRIQLATAQLTVYDLCPISRISARYTLTPSRENAEKVHLRFVLEDLRIAQVLLRLVPTL